MDNSGNHKLAEEKRRQDEVNRVAREHLKKREDEIRRRDEAAQLVDEREFEKEPNHSTRRFLEGDREHLNDRSRNGYLWKK